VLLLAVLAPGGAQSGTNFTDPAIDRLLAQSLGKDPLASYWFPDTGEPGRATEALGVEYVTIEGAAGNFNIEVGYFKGSGKGFKLVGKVRDLFGEEPRDVKFQKQGIELTTTMPKPGDPHCCPTGTARWSIDRKTLTAERSR
jgi:hypothetical protein